MILNFLASIGMMTVLGLCFFAGMVLYDLWDQRRKAAKKHHEVINEG